MIISNLTDAFHIWSGGDFENDEFWDIIKQFVPHREHITSPLQRRAG
jgi:hypothetical protein